MKKLGSYLLILILVSGCITKGKPPVNLYNDIAHMRIDGRDVFIEVADEPEERRQGLMYREKLPEDGGMLFVFDEEKQHPFWMKNTYINLDIAFVNSDDVIVDIATMQAMSYNITEPKAKAMYAIEMNEGWFGRNDVQVGDKAELIELKPKIVDDTF